ncbi:MAG: hypothetical protein U1F11_03715 [Steroidobacteraceae bacterium]
MRDLVAEVGFGRAQLIQPLFAVEGPAVPEPVPGLGDTARLPLAELGAQVDRDLEAGVRQFMLFNVGATRADDDFVDFACRAIETVRARSGGAATLWSTPACAATRAPATAACTMRAAVPTCRARWPRSPRWPPPTRRRCRRHRAERHERRPYRAPARRRSMRAATTCCRS